MRRLVIIRIREVTIPLRQVAIPVILIAWIITIREVHRRQIQIIIIKEEKP